MNSAKDKSKQRLLANVMSIFVLTAAIMSWDRLYQRRLF